jgi:amidohydrolase
MLVPSPTQQSLEIGKIIDEFRPKLEPFESIYKDFHRNPELSCQEARTAAIAAEHLKSLKFSVRENIGGHGVLGILDNGAGPTVLLRAEMDALPVLEKTNKPYASKVRMKDNDGKEKPVMHACGHDMHLACLMAAASLLHAARERWEGRLLCLFQPNEERSGGAQAMMNDGLYDDVPVPDVVLGQHVVNTRAGVIGTRSGHTLPGKNVFEVRIYGRGGHGSTPQDCIDPVVIASYIVIRLQTIISRELDPNKMALITCGSIHAGDAPNIIPEEATLKVDIRAYDPEVLDKAVRAFRRIVAAECDASGATQKPEINQIESVPPLINSPDVVIPLAKQFKAFFGEMAEVMKPDTASDDFSLLAPEGVPYAYWNFGSTDPDTWERFRKEKRLNELPGNHSALFAPLIEPTLKNGTDAMAIAALTFLTESTGSEEECSSWYDFDTNP